MNWNYILIAVLILAVIVGTRLFDYRRHYYLGNFFFRTTVTGTEKEAIGVVQLQASGKFHVEYSEIPADPNSKDTARFVIAEGLYTKVKGERLVNAKADQVAVTTYPEVANMANNRPQSFKILTIADKKLGNFSPTIKFSPDKTTMMLDDINKYIVLKKIKQSKVTDLRKYEKETKALLGE